ncbi:hypothetical protein CANTEDRAFT_110083 [Yamadazyma tenuis ATCC 10573]|uniref:Uncharacterized protein n=1 Tax=Candida tenuis (strain ATCC 10573 / BCRC 21748 / CBS 615 / JCM 9827 / NBRC 10315 / NRRL Y-1498 / VKM Y-70) TaxID=590646 RepID=G3BDF9_CANTC|nr:uncharacterized protein CANTEDRAFT_110083 [Yamadazyma tenuis ATCC 10573]EGV60290.1 hypothetical protein CANTEDRAFT_110083 [Yamadazyma tenuis ATCC 10573]
MLMASKGHFFTQIPHPIHKFSEMKAILEVGVTSIHNFPVFTTGHPFRHSCLHFFGLHLSEEIIAISVFLSLMFSV